MPSNKGNRRKSKKTTRKDKGKAEAEPPHTQKQALDPIQEAYDTENSLSGLPLSPPSRANTVATVPLDGPPSFRSSSRYSSQTSSPSPSPNPEAYVYVPVLPYYEERGGLDGGTHDVFDEVPRVQPTGLFATRTIEAGTRIICEPPLLVMSIENDEASLALNIADEYNKLSPPERDSLWTLRAVPTSLSPFLSHMMNYVHHRSLRLARFDREQLTDADRDDYDSELHRVSQSGMTYRMYARWMLNRTELRTVESDGERTTIAGVFPEAAKLRHSCVPNCHAHFNTDQDRIAVHVTKTVQAGEELTVTRIEGTYFRTAEERAKLLIEKLNILCKCEACDPNHVHFSDHESNRASAMARSVVLRDFASRMEYTYTEDGEALTTWGGSPEPHDEPAPSVEELKTHEEICNALVKNLEETGGEGIPDLIPWYLILMEYILPQLPDADGEIAEESYLNKKLYLAEERELIARRCYGEDSAEFTEAMAKLDAHRMYIDAERERRERYEYGQTVAAMEDMTVTDSE